MKSSVVVLVVVIVSISLSAAGCAQNRQVAAAQRENAELRARVAALESQVAELKDKQTLSPINIDGITLKPLEVGELRLASRPVTPAEREYSGVWGAGHLIITGSNTYTGTVTLQKAGAVSGITVQNDRVTAGRATTTTTTTSATKATSATTTTPAK